MFALSKQKKMSNNIQLTEAQKRLIEKVGVMQEKGGIQPAPSRVVALLLVSPVPELSFDQIRETLNLSKSATSNAINMLMTHERIDYITKPGDRKRYFRSKITIWKENIKSDITKFGIVADVLQEVLDQRPANTEKMNKSISEVIDFIHFLNRELPILYNKWEQSKA